MTALIIALRLVLLVLAIWCLKRTGSSLLALWDGSQSLGDAGRAAQAFFAMSVFVGQIFFLAWDEPPVLVLALILSAIGLGLAIWTGKRAQAKGTQRIDAMVNRPDLSLPLLELAEIDEQAALTLAQQARQMLAERKAAQ